MFECVLLCAALTISRFFEFRAATEVSGIFPPVARQQSAVELARSVGSQRPWPLAQAFSVSRPIRSDMSASIDYGDGNPWVSARLANGRAQLSIAQPIVELASDGTIAAAPPGTRVAFDIGLGLNSPTAQLWFGQFPDPSDTLHVFGMEANPLTAWSIRLALDARYASKKVEGKQSFAATMNMHSLNRTLDVLRRNHARYTLLPAAVGERNGFAEFELGDYNNIGTGSLYKRAQPHRAQQGFGADWIGSAAVPVVQLATLLSRIHAQAELEVLKVDAQSADLAVMKGAGVHLRRFKCVIAEEAAGGYVADENGGSDKLRAAFRAHMRSHGFVYYGGGGVWLNASPEGRARWDAHLQSGKPNLCFSHEYGHGKLTAELVAALKRADGTKGKKGVPW